jgi:hypothetical protein
MAVGENSFKHAFQAVNTDEPSLHEMEVLQQNPVPFFSSIEQSIFGRFLLTLTHRDVGELLVSDGNIVFGCHPFHFRGRVDSREQHEEDRNAAVGLGECLKDVKRRLFDVTFSHHFSDIGGQSG